jgi:hypothetical protein
MNRLCLLGILLLAGCQGVVGPRERRDNPQQVDDPRLSIYEQEKRGRDRLALPESSGDLVPRITTIPGQTGPY